ncbi:hypothetical protein SLNSH_22690 [Alsobacter soli]|uniref:Uncharacterized protein n=1 Tax=Alsobacter soli TaxID=2109933 RepID=A0A2T1HLZ4_9HYPH|nr:hypothetical protein [Alsobacter soli]PSC02673.1 hypothetical protein SLNSH_22690 [Alsobacter soli]
MNLDLIATKPGHEGRVLDELKSEIETQHGQLFSDEVWSRMALAEREAWLLEVLGLLLPDAPTNENV